MRLLLAFGITGIALLVLEDAGADLPPWVWLVVGPPACVALAVVGWRATTEDDPPDSAEAQGRLIGRDGG